MEESSVTLSGNGCRITLRHIGVSKYDISDSELQELRNKSAEYAKTMKKKSGMPGNTVITVTGTPINKRTDYNKQHIIK
ncbi:MAG: hypothetical protein LBR10_12540 [Prevotellaceae bacterium]|nr:hypothetical protein [Prevotellaceae bacterium]